MKNVAMKIEEMIKLDVPHEKIKSLLELEENPTEMLHRLKEEEALLTVKQVTERFKEALDDKMWNEAKIRRLVKQGKLQVYGQKKSNYTGYRFHYTEVERFVKEERMTKDDWKHAFFKEKSQRNDLEEQVKQLQEKLDKHQTQPPIKSTIYDVKDATLSSDGMEVTFTVKRTPFKSLFDDKKDLISVLKGKNQTEVLDELSQSEKQEIMDLYAGLKG